MDGGWWTDGWVSFRFFCLFFFFFYVPEKEEKRLIHAVVHLLCFGIYPAA